MSPGGPAVGTFNVGFENGGNISGEVTGTMTYSSTIVIAGPTDGFIPPGWTGTVSAANLLRNLLSQLLLQMDPVQLMSPPIGLSNFR